jgi:hypothetical protein
MSHSTAAQFYNLPPFLSPCSRRWFQRNLISANNEMRSNLFVAPRSNTNQGQNKSLSSYLKRGRENNPEGNTKRGETLLRFPLRSTVLLKFLTFLLTIALQLLQIVVVTKRLLRPMSVLLSY